MAWVYGSLSCYFNEYRVLYDLRVMKVSPETYRPNRNIKCTFLRMPRVYFYYQVGYAKRTDQEKGCFDLRQHKNV